MNRAWLWTGLAVALQLVLGVLSALVFHRGFVGRSAARAFLTWRRAVATSTGEEQSAVTAPRS